MELQTPGTGLIIWQVVSTITLLLLIAAIVVIVRTRGISFVSKVGWFLVSGLFPIIGPVLFFVSIRGKKQAS